MSVWPSVALGEVATIAREGVDPERIDDGTLYVGLENIRSGGDLVEVTPVARGDLASIKFRFTPDHVLYGKLRPYLAKVARPPFSGICSTDILPILPGGKLDRDYLARFLLRPESVAWAASRSAGANLPRLSPSSLTQMLIPMPPLEEQRRVAGLLDRADAIRAKRGASMACLDALSESIFLEMFGRPDGPKERMLTTPLGEHLTFVTSGSRGWAEFYAASGTRFLRSFDVQMNRIGTSDAVFVQPPDNAEARRTQVRDGDVLLTITGSRIGRVATVPEELHGSYVSQHVAILRLSQKRLNPAFLAYFLSFDGGGQRQIARAQYGQTKPGLNFEQIRRFQIPTPSMARQLEFVRRATAVEALRSTHEASLATFDSLFDSLEHRAFTGQI